MPPSSTSSSRRRLGRIGGGRVMVTRFPTVTVSDDVDMTYCFGERSRSGDFDWQLSVSRFLALCLETSLSTERGKNICYQMFQYSCTEQKGGLLTMRVIPDDAVHPIAAAKANRSTEDENKHGF